MLNYYLERRPHVVAGAARGPVLRLQLLHHTLIELAGQVIDEDPQGRLAIANPQGRLALADQRGAAARCQADPKVEPFGFRV